MNWNIPLLYTPLDIVFLLSCTALVFLMQAGFALLGAGALRAKSTMNYMAKSLMDFCIGGIVYFGVGFGIMFGSSNGLFGTDSFAPSPTNPDVLVDLLFQSMFAATAATIVAGAVAERMKLNAYVVYTVVITAFIYPVYGHWVWGGGWLAQLGLADFAGSGVVHALGGLLALVAAAILGPRTGRYDRAGRLQELPAHNQPMVVTGTLLLFFGWFGFNAGSTLAAEDATIPLIALNTFLAGCAGGVAVFVLGLGRGIVRVGPLCNGILGGLVAVTAGCAFVAPWAALALGFAGGMVSLGGQKFLDHVLKVDDPVGAVAVHGFAGIVGVLGVGVFADGSNGVSGLVAGDTSQILVQLIGVGVLAAWTLLVGGLLFFLLDRTMGLRVTPEQEEIGLDASHHGGSAYGEAPGVAAETPS